MFDHTLIKILATTSRKENSSTQFGGIRYGNLFMSKMFRMTERKSFEVLVQS